MLPVYPSPSLSTTSEFSGDDVLALLEYESISLNITV